MDLLGLSARVAALTDAHKECMTLISRLSKLPPDSGSSIARTELANLIHQTLREAEREHELIVEDIAESKDGETIHALKAKVAKVEEDLKIARLQYRKAQLAAKRSAEEQAKAERDALLGGAAARAEARRKAGVENEKTSQQDMLLSASSDVTVALRRTHTLLTSELGRSRFAHETLAQSTEALKELSKRYSAFDDVLGRSKALIRDLVQKNKSDRWYYEKAIQILLGTLIWIVLRRLFWGPIYLLLIMPLKTVWWIVASLGGVVGIRREATTTGLGADGRAGVSERLDSYTGNIGSTVVMNVEDSTMQTLETTPSPSMIEEVAKIIEGGEATVIRNPKSRKFESEPAPERDTDHSRSEEGGMRENLQRDEDEGVREVVAESTVTRDEL